MVFLTHVDRMRTRGQGSDGYSSGHWVAVQHCLKLNKVVIWDSQVGRDRELVGDMIEEQLLNQCVAAYLLRSDSSSMVRRYDVNLFMSESLTRLNKVWKTIPCTSFRTSIHRRTDTWSRLSAGCPDKHLRFLVILLFSLFNDVYSYRRDPDIILMGEEISQQHAAGVSDSRWNHAEGLRKIYEEPSGPR